MSILDLSRPARAVIIGNVSTIEEAIEAERARRLAMKAKRRPYHYWKERGDESAPSTEYWCDRCAGFYGVPHDDAHPRKSLCRNLGRNHMNRQCACIDCVVFEAWSLRQKEGK